MKKITALLLALVMLALPVLGMAASPEEMLEAAAEAGRPLTTTVSFVPGTLPVEEPVASVISDLLNALSVRVSSQKGDAPQNDFALTLSGNDVLTFSGANTGDGTAYLASSLLGADTIAINAEEGMKLVDRVVQMIAEGGDMPAADAEEIKTQLKAIVETVTATADIAAKDDAELMADIDPAALLSVFEKVMATAKTEEVTAQPKNCDPATTKVTFTATGEDVIALYKALGEMCKSSTEIMQMLDQLGQVMDGGPVSGVELLDTMVNAITEELSQFEMTAEYNFYMNEIAVTAALITMTMMNEDKEVLTAEANYARLTMDEGVTHTATMIAQDNEQNGVSISVDANERENLTTVGFSAAEIKAGVTGEPLFFVVYSNHAERADDAAKDAAKIELVINDEESGEQVRVIVTVDTAAAKQGEDVTYTADVKLYVNGEEPLLGVKVESATGTAVPSIVTADALHPGAMEDAEFSAFLNNVVMGLQINLMTVLQNLPASVQQLMMGQ